MRSSRAKERDTDILKLAAQLIDETGKKEIDIAELANRAGVSRPTVHALFGKGEEQSTKIAIFRAINDSFLEGARAAIEVALASMPPLATPIDRLTSVFRATLHTFENNETFGKVVLQHLNLKNDEENAAVFQIFAQVDRIISKARDLGELDDERVAELKDFEIRHIIFTVTRGLLRAYYLQECFPISEDGKPQRDKSGLGLKDIQVEVLRVLRVYCSKDLRDKIEAAINKVKDEHLVATQTSRKARSRTNGSKTKR